MTARNGTTIWGDPPTWIHEAEARGITPRCRGVDPDLFFPEPAGNSGAPPVAAINRAKAICKSGCALYDTCRTWALQQPAHQLYGVWGGTSRGDRLRGGLGNRKPQPEHLRRHSQRKKEAAAAH